MTPLLVDSHCHLDFPEFAGDMPRVLESMQEKGVGWALCAGVTLERFDPAPRPDDGRLRFGFVGSLQVWHGVEVMLERWQAGSSEPPHSHPGHDMTVVVQCRMRVQFYRRDGAGALQPDGEPLLLQSGQTGYVAAGRIHDAQYLDDCKLVYVHERAFGFQAEG